MLKLSVVVPIYNVELYLEDCLRSLSNQQREDIEFILINDGSTDKSKEVAEGFVNIDSRFKLFNYKNGGLSFARNMGVKHSQGEYISFLDSDDMYEIGCVNLIIKTMDSDNLDMLYFDRKLFLDGGDSSNITSTFKRDIRVIDKVMSGQEFFCLMSKYRNYSSSACYFSCKRSLLEGTFFEEGLLHEDELFTPQLLLDIKVKRVLCLGSKLYIRRVRENSIMTQKVSMRNVESYKFVCEKLAKIKVENDITKSYLDTHLKKLVFLFTKKKLEYERNISFKDKRNIINWVSSLSLKKNFLYYMLLAFICFPWLLHMKNRIFK
ncbi:alpha-1,6-rhamnosyltransferase [Pseudoalteromonas translucida KMM 520]|uniref:Alpha-1,6-rhamnosyltransferase n=1 Tax=Pseudoalteromonas translucida KMM 520 TaxID=1315283 RepID=A0A0U2WVZ5_9GAMM|nr:glycosyltransferase family 2 protein [Pseudoalteromonas translucida]ALS31793.1 alpha-1,6-rhamnosyltransferase [Pseudoalteromonas translucida KMM 520]